MLVVMLVGILLAFMYLITSLAPAEQVYMLMAVLKVILMASLHIIMSHALTAKVYPSVVMLLVMVSMVSMCLGMLMLRPASAQLYVL